MEAMDKKIKASREDIEKGELPLFPENPGVLVFKKGKRSLFYLRTNCLEKLVFFLTEEVAEKREVSSADLSQMKYEDGSSSFSESFTATQDKTTKEQTVLDNGQIEDYVKPGEENDNRQRKAMEPVLAEFDRFDCYPAEGEFHALVIEKRLLIQEIPEYYHEVRLYDQYPYLALSHLEKPFLSVKEDTAENYLYIGPFADRFFLLEVIDIFNNLLCSQTDSASEGEGSSTVTIEPEMKEITEFFLRNIITINQELPDRLKKKVSLLENNLQFSEAQEIKVTAKVIERYYRDLLFFHSIKHLNGTLTIDNIQYTIKNGLLDSIRQGSVTETFSIINNHFEDYEKKEYLALPKENFREMWTLFEKFYAYYPEKIDEIYMKSILNIEKSINREY